MNNARSNDSPPSLTFANFNPLMRWLIGCVAIVTIVTSSVSSSAHCVAQDSTPEKRQPNVIYILADDLGFGDLSCYGQQKFETPNIDSLARNGLRFTQHYSGSTVCAPSRCSLMTGLHTGHTCVRGNAEAQPEGQAPMPADTFTVAHLMQRAGYRTGIFGKWGLGAPGSASEPLKMGFDRFYGYNCQRIAHSYYPAFLWNDDKRELLFGNVAEDRGEYAPDVIHDQALKFIRKNKDQPFFCYYAAIQPHADIVAPERYMEKHRGKYGKEKPHRRGHYRAQPEPRAAFAGMVNVLDDYVGDIVAELEKLGIADNTLIIFTSDNGPHTEGGHDPAYFDSNGNQRGVKRDLYEGGTHVPMIASWPAAIEPGLTSDHISAFWDFLPTMAELTGQELPNKTDGVSILPTLLGQPNQPVHNYLYWEFPARKGRISIRKGKWKAVRYKASINPNSPLELYDLSVDPGEENNVAALQPETVSMMRNLLIDVRTPPTNPKFDYLTNRKQKQP